MAKKNVGGLEGFKEFIRKNGVVGLGTAFVLGGAAVEFMGIFVGSLVTPIINRILNSTGSTEGALAVDLGEGYSLGFGDALTGLLNFLVIMFVVYMLLKLTGIDKWDSKD